MIATRGRGRFSSHSPAQRVYFDVLRAQEIMAKRPCAGYGVRGRMGVEAGPSAPATGFLAAK